ncbi:MAG: helix-turn-helix domain-containing protein [Thermogutta sp.]|uniref:helix-turn-helix domain-containing protein n=1 Tax=Thermogutta sp. TaxID=1962930 RepID=UPI00198F4C28|nr:helix-turn-helix domain-containing protein [Thermogutta sp.]MBC7353996.1 helix-turn-helix domain-containing protein [Thermogutta sp.]
MKHHCPHQNSLLLTLPEVARLLRVSQRTAWTWAKAGKLPSLRIGRCLRFPRHAVEKWIEQELASQSGRGDSAGEGDNSLPDQPQ